MTPPRPDLDALEQLLDGVTPAPWRAAPGKNAATVAASDCAVYINVDREGAPHPDTVKRWQADARFIATARTALPALVAEVRRLTIDRDSYANSNFEGQLSDARAEVARLAGGIDAMAATLAESGAEVDRLRGLLVEATSIAARVIADAQVLPSTDSDHIEFIRTEGGLP